MRRYQIIALPLAAALAFASAPASATITITTDQQTGQGDNILFPSGDSDGPVVTGVTQNGYQLTFTTTTGQTLTTPSQGQARIETASGESLTSIEITPTDGIGFDFIEFNLFGGGNPGSLYVYAFDQFGNLFDETFTGNLNGENFTFAATDAAQYITKIGFTGTPGISDIRQIRVGPGANMSAVPEPAAWAMLLFGFGGLGFVMRRRKSLEGKVRMRIAYS